ncbi:hypothetical protein ACFE04_003741 [Oxalis oulophora]
MKQSIIISAIQQSTDLNSLKTIHAHFIKSSHFLLPRNILITTNLISQYISLNSISHAFTLFSSTRSPDTYLYNLIITASLHNNEHHRCLNLYSNLLKLFPNEIRPDNFTFPLVIKACGSLQDFKLGTKVHGHVVVNGFASDSFVANSLMSMYGKVKRVDIARRVFDKMTDRNVVSWSSIIGVYANNGCHQEGVLLFWRMLDERIKPNRGVVMNVMACVTKEKEADRIWRVIHGVGLSSDRSVQNAVMLMYARRGRIDAAKRFFDGFMNKDLVLWASMIEAYCKANMPFEALQLFKRMRLKGCVPDYVTLLNVVRSCSVMLSLHHARTIHGTITCGGHGDSCLKNHIALNTALVDMYVKCGSLTCARKVFDRMLDKNVITWSTMISGYGMHGDGGAALLLFYQMKASSIKPDHILFVSVLSACSHSGFVDEGQQLFNAMVRDFGITPMTEHYACMVDLLGRSGKLNEALDFIQKMPVKPDAGVWGALLGACRIHSNVKMAKMAAESLFNLDSENPGRYVILSNVYASSGKIKEADRIRALMKSRGVRKQAGHTLIEI